MPTLEEINKKKAELERLLKEKEKDLKEDNYKQEIAILKGTIRTKDVNIELKDAEIDVLKQERAILLNKYNKKLRMMFYILIGLGTVALGLLVALILVLVLK